ncbi:MAG TPA: 2-dehydropantoate 2-reductase N-terminal domain-containing protein [Polyangiaceae bacterium]|nr:2-dehydropantoate 2-reductase N-terminal domain-containing protein [Polyangiaceae bacterium]
MRILVIGAGVIGSFNAARLAEGGQDVTLLARGRRLAELREHGVVLENARTGQRTTTRVPLVERISPEDRYDLAVVVVRRNQIPSVLPMLTQAKGIASVLFLGNNAAGPQEMIDALGRDRVLIGVVNAGGERRGHVVRYLWWRSLPLQISELDGQPSPRTAAIISAFRRAGLPARMNPRLDAFLKTHAAGLPGFAGALYRAGGSIHALAHRPDLLRLFVESMRESMRALLVLGVPLTPPSIRLVLWLPIPLLVSGLRLFFDTKLAEVGGERHANAAVDEMKEIADEIRDLFRQSGVDAPASAELFASVDAQAQRSNTPMTPGGTRGCKAASRMRAP